MSLSSSIIDLNLNSMREIPKYQCSKRKLKAAYFNFSYTIIHNPFGWKLVGGEKVLLGRSCWQEGRGGVGSMFGSFWKGKWKEIWKAISLLSSKPGNLQYFQTCLWYCSLSFPSDIHSNSTLIIPSLCVTVNVIN